MSSWACCPGSALTPVAGRGLVRLGASLPFAQAAELLAHFTGVRVGAETVRRLTEAAGAAQVAVRDGGGGGAGADAAGRAARPGGAAAERRRGDGAAGRRGVGRGQDAGRRRGRRPAPTAPRTTALSYFSRLDRRRRPSGTWPRSRPTGAARDGGDGGGGGPTAPRGARASSTSTGPTRCASSTSRTPSSTWRGGAGRLRARHGGGQRLAGAAGARAAARRGGRGAGDPRRPGAPADLGRGGAPRGGGADPRLPGDPARPDPLRAFAAAGLPDRQRRVESANKLVVEARLKGPGMHWARANVDPLLALRCLLANGRWATAWPAVCGGSAPRGPRRGPAPPAPAALAPAPVVPAPTPSPLRTAAHRRRRRPPRPKPSSTANPPPPTPGSAASPSAQNHESHPAGSGVLTSKRFDTRLLAIVEALR